MRHLTPSTTGLCRAFCISVVAFFSLQPLQLRAAVEVSDIQLSNGNAAYSLQTLQDQVKIYADRSYVFEAPIPLRLTDQQVFVTRNNDKANTSAEFLSFTINAPATIAVLYDSRVTTLPAWLDQSEWVKQDFKVQTSDVQRLVFTREYAKGERVILGGNSQAPMLGSNSMYSAVVVEKSGSAVEPYVPAEPGLGNLTYNDSEAFNPIALINSPAGHGNVAMVNGYLMTIYSVDGGGTSGDGGIEFWDVSNPREPQMVIRYDDEQTHGLREPHGFGFSNSYGGLHMVAQGVEGIQFWDMTDPLDIELVNYMDLPEISQGDYTGDWWVFWQAPYVYVAGTTSGLYVIDASDLENPTVLKRLTASQLGGMNPATVFAIGNLLFIAEAQSNAMATLDISDPANPKLIERFNGKKGYSHLFAAGKVLTSGGNGDPARMYVHDLSWDGHFSYVGESGRGLGNGGYGSYQDGYFLSGFSSKFAKFNIGTLTQLGAGSSGLTSRDEDFAQALGNLVFVGNDHGGGSALIAHQAGPDVTPPSVTWVYPPDGATEMAVTSRIGVSLSDSIDLNSVNQQTFKVESEIGDSVSGKFSVQMGILNFTPDQPLQPNTTYQIRLAGIADLVGNLSETFQAQFTTLSDGSSSGGLVDSVEASSGRSYRQTTLTEGVALHSDSTDVKVTGYPEALDGLALIQTASADSNYATEQLLQFELSESGYVYLMVDESAGVPAWLSTWQRSSESIATTAGNFALYSHLYEAGSVSLGANLDSSGGGGQMYAVLVMAESEGVAPGCDLPGMMPVAVGADAAFSVNASGSLPLTYGWSFGDSRGTSDDAAPSYAYDENGRFSVVLHLQNPFGTTSCATTRIAYHPTTVKPSAQSSSMVMYQDYLYIVNPDNDTLTAIDAITLEKYWETPVGKRPVSVAIGKEGSIWVVNQFNPSLMQINPKSGAILSTVTLPNGSRPHGLVFSPAENTAYLTLQASQKILQLDGLTAEIQNEISVPWMPKGLAITADGAKLYVSRFISPDDRGEVHVVDTADFSLIGMLPLAYDQGPDTEASGRGVPNYLAAPVISNDGRRMLVPSKKDNISRGLYRDGKPLTFESRVRTIVSQIDLTSSTEIEDVRVDLNDRAMAQSVLFSPLSDIYFVASLSSNRIEAYDTRTGVLLAGLNTGRAPQALAISDDGAWLYVHNYLSRSLSVFDISSIIDGSDNNAALVDEVSLVSNEKLSASLLNGKRIFYNAADLRMSRDGYISCAACHLDGDEDGRVWDFTQDGEGLRNTISLLGRAGMGHGNLHWTANFDEVQDFEGEIRQSFSGSGFLTDAQFANTANPLGAKKTGLNSDLDDLAAYVASFDQVPNSPYRQADGSLTEEGELGKQLFFEFACDECHSGTNFTDELRHDVGTTDSASGTGMSQPLAGIGIETPTLKGLWLTKPYLHNGKYFSLQKVIRSKAHTGVAFITVAERALLESYLLQIDERETASECGGLIQEAENGEFAGDFQVMENALASGGAYLGVPDGTGNNWRGASNTASIATYCVNVEEAGDYYFRGWVNAPTDSDNTFYVQVDGITSNGYVWLTDINKPETPYYLLDGSRGRRLFSLGAGEHEISVILREDGAQLDKIELLKAP